MATAVLGGGASVVSTSRPTPQYESIVHVLPRFLPVNPTVPRAARSSLTALHALPTHVERPDDEPLQTSTTLTYYQRKKIRALKEERRRVFGAWKKLYMDKRRKRLRKEREERFQRWRTDEPELPPHMTRKAPALPQVVRPDKEIAEKVENRIHREYRTKCYCAACRCVVRDSLVVDQYCCRVFNCKLRFDDLAEFLEHQLDDHSMLTVHCKRVRQEFYRFQAGTMHPPSTVFIGFQFLNPTERPTLWTMEQVETENETLLSRLQTVNRRLHILKGQAKHSIYVSFKYAYEQVKRYGVSQLNEQYRLALEHYESSLVFPVAPRNRQDGISAIGIGRNWLVSPEPENAERSRLLTLLGAQVVDEKKPKTVAGGGGVEYEDDETDDEVVLFEFGDLHESHADNQNETTCAEAKATHDDDNDDENDDGDEPQVILL